MWQKCNKKINSNDIVLEEIPLEQAHSKSEKFMRLPMRRVEKFGTTEDVRNEWLCERYNCYKIRKYSKWLQRFLTKNVGRTYNEVFSEFCHRVPVHYLGENSRYYFNWYLQGNHWVRKFYIDNEGIIRKTSTIKKIRPHKYISGYINKGHRRRCKKALHDKYTRIYNEALYPE